MPSRISADHPIRELFQGLVERAFHSQLGLSDAELNPLFTAANVTADSRQTDAYRWWLDGGPPTRGMSPRRLLALLERRRERRVRGTEF